MLIEPKHFSEKRLCEKKLSGLEAGRLKRFDAAALMRPEGCPEADQSSIYA